MSLQLSSVVAGGGGGGGGVTAFIQLSDVPSSYAGEAGKALRVNAGETGLEFFAAAGSGTVTTVSVVSANGFAGTVATDTTTPAITLTTTITGILSGNGTAISAASTTGSGAVVLATSPTLVTPVLGVATATTINKVTLTTPATGSTLTVADGKTLTASNTLTFTGTDSSSVAFGAGGTVAYTANNLSVFAATTSAQLAGIITDETGSGALVFGTSPVFTTDITLPNTGLHILDTNATHDLIIAPGSNLTADRTLSIITGDAAVNLDLTAVTDEFVLAYDTGTNTWRGVAGGGGGGGDVTGPSSSVDNSIVRFDGTTGKLIQGYTSGAPTISDTGAITATQGGSLTGTWSDLGTVSQVAIEGGSIDGTTIGVTTPSSGEFTSLTVDNAGLLLYDSDHSNTLAITNNSNLTADRTLTVTTGDAAVNLDLTAVTDEFVLAYDSGTNTWRGVSGGGGSGATTALDNLASVAINAALVLGTSDAFALGSTTKQWSDLFLAEGGVINWDNGDLTLTQTGNSLELAGGELTLPNTGLHILDTNATHDLIIAPGSNLTADRTLTVTTGDAAVNLDLTAVTDEFVLAYDSGTNTWRGVVGGGGGGVSLGKIQAVHANRSNTWLTSLS